MSMQENAFTETDCLLFCIILLSRPLLVQNKLKLSAGAHGPGIIQIH